MTHAEATMDIQVDWEESPTAKAHLNLAAYAKQEEERLAAKDPQDLATQLLEGAVPLTRVPMFSLSTKNLAPFALSSEAKHLLSRVDGCSSLQEILAGTSTPLQEGLRTFADFSRRGVVRLR